MNNSSMSYIEQLRQKEVEQEQRLKEEAAQYEKKMVAEVISAIKHECDLLEHDIEGVIELQWGEWHNDYRIVYCKKREISMHTPTSKEHRRNGILDASINIELFKELLVKEINTLGFNHFDYKIIPITNTEEKGVGLFGFNKWRSTGETSYDIWVQVRW